ncbi:MAG: tape measure protein [Treponema sp.]|jgi:tape measure domain-containing protein|nr:tape measure protein [Treponema sp.]
MNEKTLELQIKIIAEKALAQVKALSGDLKELAANAKTFAEDSNAVTRTLQLCQKDAASAANSFKLFGASSAEVRHQQELAKKSAVELVNAGLKPESQEVQNLVAQYKKLGAQADEIDKANGGNIKSFGELKTAVTQTAAAVALIKTVDKVKDLTGFALAQADAFQTARNEFGILLGDMEAGAGLFNQIKAFNDKTPFSLDTTKQAVNVLLSADVPLTQLNERLRQFGDLSQGNSQRFSSYVDAFSKAAAKGKVDMQVLNTYLNQGVPILKELAAGFNVTQEEIVDMVSKGQISFRDFSAALERLTAEGGKYFGGMELGSKSLAAMQEGLRESVNSLAASYGQALAPAASKALEIFTNMISAINDSPLLKGILAGAVVALTGYLAAMAVKQAALAVKTWLAYAAQMGFNSALAVTNPALLAGIAAAAAATVAIVAYAAERQKANDISAAAALAAKKEADAMQNAASAAKQYAQALDDLSVGSQRRFISDEQSKLAKLYEEKARLERAIANIPQTITETKTVRKGSMPVEITVEKINPVYERLKKDIDEVNRSITQTGANINALFTHSGELQRTRLAAFGTDWQDKLKTGIEAINREEDKALAELKTKAFSAFKDGFAKNKAYTDELEALREYYRRKRADLEGKDIKELGTAWQDKMLSAEKAVEKERRQSLEDLRERASEIYRENFEEQAAYIAELAALNAYYDKKREDAQKKKPKIGTEWREAVMSQLEALKNRYDDAMRELEDKFKNLTLTDQPEYWKELAALVEWEKRERQKIERDLVIQAHNLRMENYREEWEYRRELARREIESGNFRSSGTFMMSQFMSHNNGSRLGELFSAFGRVSGGAQAAGGAMQGAASNFSAAGAVWLQLIKALVEAVMELENMKKIMSWANTVVDEAFKTIGPMINETLAVFSEPLEEIGQVIGQILAPLLGIIQMIAALNRFINSGLLLPLHLLGAGFEWLYNHAVYPAGNAIINAINKVIDLINQIPGVNINRINQLNLIGGMAVEMAEEMERRKEEITRLYERQKDRVRDELSAQISSIRQQYELGLISRQNYEEQAEQYQSAADTRLLDINEEMKGLLEEIANNTYAGLTPEQQAAAESAEGFFNNRYTQGSLQTAGAFIAPVTNALVSTVASAAQGKWGEAAANLFTGGLFGGLRKLIGFDSGTPFVPRDMAAVIHQGEGIIPRTFNEGIRSGEYALVGKGRRGRETVLSVNVNVSGSVVTERELTTAIYRGIADGIKSGGLDPLPA